MLYTVIQANFDKIKSKKTKKKKKSNSSLLQELHFPLKFFENYIF